MPPLKLLVLTDGKPGHAAQLRGLEEALRRRTAVTASWRDVTGDGPALACRPDWIAAAGRRTHWPLLRAARKYKARSIVLMRPSLPRRLYDICVIPEHDGVRGRNVLTTFGVLNDLPPSTPGEQEVREGVALLGGPSKHHVWDGIGVLAAMNDLLRSDASVKWTVTSSRRTPPEEIDRLRRRFTGDRQVRFVPHTQTPAGWVRQQLGRSGVAAVTEDSVSMLAEAITAGCRTVVLPLPRVGKGRVAGFVDAAIAKGFATRPPLLPTWRPAPALREADRVAEELLGRLSGIRRAA